MEHDIRELFKNNDDVTSEIPKNHREEFLAKLQQHNQQKKSKKYRGNRVAILLVLLMASAIYFLFLKPNFSVNDTSIQAQVKKIEKEYLHNINEEWSKFISISKDSVLIHKYEKKLNEFDKNYQKITKQLHKNPNNIYVLEALINNLQRRLELIKDIKEHTKELNQKNKTNETIYI